MALDGIALLHAMAFHLGNWRRLVILFCISAAVMGILLQAMPETNPAYFVFFCIEAPVVVHMLLVCGARRSVHLISWVALHVLAAIGLCLGVIVFLSCNSAWCCIQRSHSEALCKELNALHDAMDSWGTVHWLCKGSLLAAARLGMPIPWENDEDLCVLGDPRLGQHLTSAGFNVLWAGQRPVMRALLPSLFMNFAEIWIDIFDFRVFNLTNGDNALVALSTTTLHFPDGQAKIPETFVEAQSCFRSPACNKFMPMYSDQLSPLGHMEYCGRQWPVPKDTLTLLRNVYGPEWRIPKMDTAFNGIRAWTCGIWMDGCAGERVPIPAFSV